MRRKALLSLLCLLMGVFMLGIPAAAAANPGGGTAQPYSFTDPVPPEISVTGISTKYVGDTVTVKATSTTPCYRMSAKYVHNGTTKWLGDVKGRNYSKTFTVSSAGTYTVTVYARNYPESDSRSCSSSESVSFTVRERVVTPTVTLPSIADQTVENTVTVKGSATTPCYRMSAKVVHNGVTKWLGDQSGASYSKTYTVTEAGQYGVTLYARSYPESDARSGQGVKTVWFNAYDPVRPTVTLNSITGTKKVGGVITVSGTSSTPCYRMAAKVEHDGVRNWLGEVSGSTYSKTYTIPEPGTYTVTLISRSYAESNPRSGTAEDSVTFTVTGDSKNLSVPLYKQSKNDTCGPASAGMILGYFGIGGSAPEKTKGPMEKSIVDYIEGRNNENKDYKDQNNLATAINYFHPSGPSYFVEEVDQYSVTEFLNLVKHNINNGCPVQALIEPQNESGGFPYYSPGHYVVITGYSGNNLYINDPHYYRSESSGYEESFCNRYVISASKILSYIATKDADNPIVICAYR